MKTLRQLQEELRQHEAPESVVFMFGRFNPPTLGHEKMVECAVRVARKFGISDVRLYASFSQDVKKNPILHEEKIKWLRKFFTGVKVVEDRDARSPFDVARKLSEEGVKRVVMIAGGDRASEFQYRIGKYINHPDPEKSFSFEDFQVVSGGDRDPDADDASGVSASQMREFAATKDFESFVKGLPTRANMMDGKELFEAIRRGMNLEESGIVIDKRLARINEDFEQLDEITTITKFWFNTKTNKFIKVTKTEENHDWAPIMKPAKFGLKSSDTEKFQRAMDRFQDEIPGVKRIMLSGGWVRVAVFSGNAGWNLQSRNLDDAAAAAKALIRKDPDPAVIFMDYGKKSATLEGNQIKQFVRTGKIVERSKLARFRREDHQLDEKIRGQDKWWWSARTGVLVEVRANFHAQQVVREPKSFGLTEKDLKELVPPNPEMQETIPALQRFLKKKGWVEVTFSHGVGELMIRALNSKDAQKALNKFLNFKYPDPDEARIVWRGQAAIRLVGRQAISTFAKTGKQIRQSPLSAFR